jgi:hypothetical protein
MSVKISIIIPIYANPLSMNISMGSNSISGCSGCLDGDPSNVTMISRLHSDMSADALSKLLISRSAE